MGIKLKDIAKRANVSITTASLVLNNKASNISEKTKLAVFAAARELGYLKENNVPNIGLIVPDLANLFYIELVKGIFQSAKQNGFNIIIFNSDNNPEQEIEELYSLKETDVHGIIMCFAPTDKSLDKFQPVFQEIFSQNGVPIILFDRFDPFLKNCHSVGVDNFYGGYLAANHLLELGHRRIGCITGRAGTTQASGSARTDGYRSAFQKLGLEYSEDWIIDGNYSIESGYNNTEYLLKQGVTAIFAQNDMMALGVYHYLKEHHLRVPEDLSLVGFDNVSLISMLDMPLTTVAQPIQVISERMVEILISFFVTGRTDERLSIVLQPELIVRNSTALGKTEPAIKKWTPKKHTIKSANKSP